MIKKFITTRVFIKVSKFLDKRIETLVVKSGGTLDSPEYLDYQEQMASLRAAVSGKKRK